MSGNLSSLIKPHGGGDLVNRTNTGVQTEGLAPVVIDNALANDVENISDGIFTPLEGFMCEQDFESVVRSGRLKNDLPWTIPIVLDVDEQTSAMIKNAGDVLLRDPQGTDVAVLHAEDVYKFDKQHVTQEVYGTSDATHPGVARVMAMKDFLVGGKIDYVRKPVNDTIRDHRLTPAQTREAFSQAGWLTIVAFQTRNPPHVAHEMIQKTSFRMMCDGVFVNPIMGRKKPGDFADDVIVKCYETMIKLYYPPNTCMLGTLHTDMRYAGPKEAVHHAIMRQNYGCSHIIIGRDHAGVGSFYEPDAAQKIFDEYPDLEITPVFFPALFYCHTCLTYTTTKACPHDADTREQVSGTKLREMIQNGKSPSKFILRPEVARIILDHPKPFVD